MADSIPAAGPLEQTGPSRWREVLIGGRPADVLVPEGPPAGGAIFLHGYSGDRLSGSRAYVEALLRQSLLVVCPRGGRSWWLDRETPEFAGMSPMAHIVDEVLPWVEAEAAVARPAVGLFGIGMGGQGALNIAYRHGRDFAVVAAVSPAIDFQLLHGRGTILDELFESPEAARQETAILHLHPLNWPEHQLILCDPRDPQWHVGAERLCSKLSSSGIPFRADLTTQAGATGWGWDYFDAQAAAVAEFLAASARDVRARL